MTTSLDARCLETFPNWLSGLAPDARVLADLLTDESSEATRRVAVASLAYLLKSLDGLDEGLEDLGLFEDACVVRVLAATLPADEHALDSTGSLARLAAEAALLTDFIGEAGVLRLVQSVTPLEGTAHGGSEALEDPEARAALIENVRRWADDYRAPAAFRDAKDLLKLKAFLLARFASGASPNSPGPSAG